MCFEMLIQVTHVCECFTAVFDWADMRSDFEVNDFVVSLERICLNVSDEMLR